ncbi:hypothetical protein B0H11DRAFT_1271861 [Mycena galericulata]|nr:hypothetical protein B0H11DRAFT_1271861 [Mycena galericulata]
MTHGQDANDLYDLRSIYLATGFSYRTPANFILLSLMMMMNTAGPTVIYSANGFSYRTPPAFIYARLHANDFYDHPRLLHSAIGFSSRTPSFFSRPSVHTSVLSCRSIRLPTPVASVLKRVSSPSTFVTPTVHSIGIWLLVLDTPRAHTIYPSRLRHPPATPQ